MKTWGLKEPEGVKPPYKSSMDNKLFNQLVVLNN